MLVLVLVLVLLVLVLLVLVLVPPLQEDYSFSRPEQSECFKRRNSHLLGEPNSLPGTSLSADHRELEDLLPRPPHCRP